MRTDTRTSRLARTLRRARAVWALADGARALARWAAPVVAGLVALCVLDNVAHLPGPLRLAAGVAWLGAAVLGFAVFVYPVLARRRSAEATARMLEQRLKVADNVLINAVQLARDELPVPEAALAEIHGQAEERAGVLEPARLWRLRPLRRSLAFAAGAAALAALYAALFPDYAGNALARLGDPLGEIVPLTVARISVEPGHARVVAGESIEIRATVSVRSGELPRAATLHLRSGAEPWQHVAMVLLSDSGERRVFASSAGPLATDLGYRVEAGDAITRTFRVEVVRPPAVESVALAVEPPAYTGEAARESRDPALVRAPRGARVTLVFEADRTPLRAELALPDGVTLERGIPPGRFVFEAGEPGRLRLDLRDEAADIRAPEAWAAELSVIEDAAPTVRLSGSQRSQLMPPGADLPLTAIAGDDYGLAALRFLVQRVSNGVESELKRWRYAEPGERTVTERIVLPLDPAAFRPGETYRFLAETADHHPPAAHTTRSKAVVVRIARPDELAVAQSHPFFAPFELLRRLVEQQRQAVARSAALVELEKEHVAGGRLQQRALLMARDQFRIRKGVVEAAIRFRAVAGSGARFAEELERLDREELASLESLLRGLRMDSATGEVRHAVAGALPFQRRALAALEALLGRVAFAAASPQEASEPEQGEPPGKPWEKDLAAKAEKLREFLDEQRRLVELTRELEQRDPEDWTEKDDETLGRLEANELEWARFFEEAFTDLSKVPDQDFSNSGLAEEFNEVYMEVKKAADALSEKKVEIAVPLEQSGLEMAEELVHNLERWLPDTPDHTKWVMEEPASDFDVPLADLPDELEDIVGDLIDDAEAMDESIEDVSSGWMDSLDHGAGWDASGGPISNMSAKGITGNRLPNTDEIGGRSGEGRSGKSHGQFVERTAEGKGGRETPTRLTEDPFESGSVEDRSNEATGGSTGGGKLAGQGMDGLRGRVPPPVQGKLERLANHQGELRQRAERLARTLRKLHLPAGDVEDAAALLGWSENHLREAIGFDLRRAHGDVKQALRRARGSLEYEADTLRERGATLPKRIRDELMGALSRGVPPGYEDILKAYYRAIAEGR